MSTLIGHRPTKTSRQKTLHQANVKVEKVPGPYSLTSINFTHYVEIYGSQIDWVLEDERT